jgi:hypothetical protein
MDLDHNCPAPAFSMNGKNAKLSALPIRQRELVGDLMPESTEDSRASL